jgi:hypothetical protein
LDIDCYAKVPGRPYMPVEIFDEIQRVLGDQPGIETLGETLRALKGAI